MKDEIQKCILIQLLAKHTLFLMSKAHEAPELPPMPISICPTPPRPRPPVPRVAIHFIADAPSPRLSSTTTLSRGRVVRRDVNVTSKEANRTLVNEGVINTLDHTVVFLEVKGRFKTKRNGNVIFGNT